MVRVSNNDKTSAAGGLRTLDRGLAVLELVTGKVEGATVREISQELRLNLATCYHLINTLLARGYLVKGLDRRIRLGPAVGRLYAAYARTLRPEQELLPILTLLSVQTEETAYLATWENDEVVLRSVVEGPHPLRVSGLTPGLRGAAHCRASGKAMLAYLEESELLRYLRTHSLAPLTDRSITDVQRLREDLERIAQQGFAEDLGEFAPDICCVAAPYFDAQGKVAGALTISMPLFRHSQKGPQVAAAVLAAGEQASRAMGYAGSYPPHK